MVMAKEAVVRPLDRLGNRAITELNEVEYQKRIGGEGLLFIEKAFLQSRKGTYPHIVVSNDAFLSHLNSFVNRKAP